MKRVGIIAVGALCVSALRVTLAGSVCPDWVGDDLPGSFASGATVPPLSETGSRGVFVEGDYARFERVWARLERGEPVRITVDGSTYWKVRSVAFDDTVRKELAALAPGIPFDIFRTDDAPMVGAAVAAWHRTLNGGRQ